MRLLSHVVSLNGQEAHDTICHELLYVVFHGHGSARCRPRHPKPAPVRSQKKRAHMTIFLVG